MIAGPGLLRLVIVPVKGKHITYNDVRSVDYNSTTRMLSFEFGDPQDMSEHRLPPHKAFRVSPAIGGDRS